VTTAKQARSEDATDDLHGRTAVVTGANSGVGLATAQLLAEHGARIVLACRDKSKGLRAAGQIAHATPGAAVEYRALDLADLASVRRFAGQASGDFDGIDILVNNAGVMGGPHRRTADGFEMHLGTNHLGHFALTGLLLPLLLARAGGRVVTVSSSIAARGKIDFEDLQGERGYRWFPVYARSKLANLMFALELDHRATQGKTGLISLASHPGAASSSLLTGKEQDWSRSPRLSEVILARIQALTGQPPRRAARPSLYAATAGGLTGGEYIGPGGWTHLRGAPKEVPIPRAAFDPAVRRRLWDLSARLTGVDYAALT
jgi:NAD(P)-dependent dehydrogenase (short-subunit alcohol dehydrogenase family)